MSKLVVDFEWLISQLDNLHGTDENIKAFMLAHYPVYPLTPAQEQTINNPAAQFAGRMEELLRIAISPFDGMEQSEFNAACFQGYGRQGQKIAGFVLETQQLLADIQKAKGEGS